MAYSSGTKNKSSTICCLYVARMAIGKQHPSKVAACLTLDASNSNMPCQIFKLPKIDW